MLASTHFITSSNASFYSFQETLLWLLGARTMMIYHQVSITIKNNLPLDQCQQRYTTRLVLAIVLMINYHYFSANISKSMFLLQSSYKNIFIGRTFLISEHLSFWLVKHTVPVTEYENGPRSNTLKLIHVSTIICIIKYHTIGRRQWQILRLC